MKRVFGIAILMAATFNFAFGQCSDADKKALEGLDKAWSVAGQNGDKAALMNIYADDFAGFPDMVGKTAAIDDTMAAFEDSKTNPPTSTTTPDHYIVTCTPVSATVTHRNVTVSKSGSTTYSRSVHFLEKRGGRWQVVSNVGGSLNDGGIIWYLEQDWNNAILKRDRGWFEKNYAADFTGVDTMTGKLSNKGEDIAGLMNDKGTLELAETSEMNVRVDGDRAIVTGIFRTKGKDEKGVAYDRRSRFTDTWIKRDGRWMAWASQGTLIQ
ncbi:MAG: nuclear transport factor 2 family protein [Pyrinomonadaceae bacterium]